MNKKYIMSLDQGTTGSRCIIFATDGTPVIADAMEYPLHFPHDGWVEQKAEDIWNSQITVAKKALEKSEIKAEDIAAIGITNQRETTIVWEKSTGTPICNAIVWQCRRTAEYCDSLKADGYEEFIRKKTGLLIDPYFSATKLKWILDNVDGARERAENGELLFGTVDTWLAYNLSGGKAHITDMSNASRTMLFNINTCEWDDELLKFFNIPKCMLPEIVPSSGKLAETDPALFGMPILIGGIAGDQQAALFGQLCHKAGDVKNTYGTGGFMLMNTGSKPVFSENGLLTSIAWTLEGEPTNYVLEGSAFICGAAVQWLRDGLRILETAAESENKASLVKDSGGVYFVPGFVGLAAPYWDPYARASFHGITRGTTQEHIIRAVLDAMTYQTDDILTLMQKETGLRINGLRVDGGASANNLIMQLQANNSGVIIQRPECVEVTALGTAMLAGLGAGVYKDRDQLGEFAGRFSTFNPDPADIGRNERLAKWHKAVERTLAWEC